MNLDLVANFLTLTESGLNLKKTAQKLYIAQSTLSRQMTSLEQQLGVALFIRDGHSLQLTEAGAALKEQAPALLQHATELGDRLVEISDGQVRDLIVASFTLTERTFLKGISNFRQAYNSVNLKIIPTEPDNALTMLMTRACDVAFVTDTALQQLSKETLSVLTSKAISVALGCVVVSPTHPLATLSSVTVQNLSGEKLVTVEDPSANRRLLLEFERMHFTPASLTAADSRTLRYNVNQMNAVAIMFDSVVTDVLDTYVSIPLLGCNLETELKLVTHRSHSDLVEALLNCYN